MILYIFASLFCFQLFIYFSMKKVFAYLARYCFQGIKWGELSFKQFIFLRKLYHFNAQYFNFTITFIY